MSASFPYRTEKKQNEYEPNRIFKQKLGGTALVPMLVDEDRLVSFCTFAPKDFANRITMELLPAKLRHCS